MQTELGDAIEHIYADMEGGGRWPDILRSLCQLLDADAGIMFAALFGPETLTSDALHDGRVVFSHGANCCDLHMHMQVTAVGAMAKHHTAIMERVTC